MRAAICYEFGAPLVAGEVALAPPGRGEVRVRVAACAICASDLHLIRGDWGGALPLVPGHEAAGVVEEVGPGVVSACPGDHVVVSMLRSCGRCFQCAIGRPFTCEGSFALDSESRLRDGDGVALTHGLRTAAFADHAIVDQSQVVKVPEDMPLDQASLLACGVVTGVGAVAGTARVEAGASVVIVGAGGVGMNAIQGASLAGASRIVAVDVQESKLAAARRFGATHTVDAHAGDAVQAVRGLTAGRGADYVLVATGSPAAIAESVHMIRVGGTVVLVGIPSDADAVVPIDVNCLTCGSTLLGSKLGSTRLAVDVPRLADLWREGRLELALLISARWPLGRINEALESTARGESLRNVIVFD